MQGMPLCPVPVDRSQKALPAQDSDSSMSRPAYEQKKLVSGRLQQEVDSQSSTEGMRQQIKTAQRRSDALESDLEACRKVLATAEQQTHRQVNILDLHPLCRIRLLPGIATCQEDTQVMVW